MKKSIIYLICSSVSVFFFHNILAQTDSDSKPYTCPLLPQATYVYGQNIKDSNKNIWFLWMQADTAEFKVDSWASQDVKTKQPGLVEISCTSNTLTDQQILVSVVLNVQASSCSAADNGDFSCEE